VLVEAGHLLVQVVGLAVAVAEEAHKQVVLGRKVVMAEFLKQQLLLLLDTVAVVVALEPLELQETPLVTAETVQLQLLLELL
jgi:hypothetical protein